MLRSLIELQHSIEMVEKMLQKMCSTCKPIDDQWDARIIKLHELQWQSEGRDWALVSCVNWVYIAISVSRFSKAFKCFLINSCRTLLLTWILAQFLCNWRHQGRNLRMTSFRNIACFFPFLTSLRASVIVIRSTSLTRFPLASKH